MPRIAAVEYNVRVKESATESLYYTVKSGYTLRATQLQYRLTEQDFSLNIEQELIDNRLYQFKN
ncbi:hypothetical protein C4834_17590 [Salmonella enterica subsp. enterica serovar Newport]|nr:hypothetical protein C4834_17590 [Salmonella enterica subsp. enterica serovar Newport]